MVKFGNKLESSRKDGILANTDNIYDKRTGEMQETINQKIANVSPADEEDLTKTIDEEGRSVTKFADRSYSPSNFSGKGYKILRKNIQKVSLAVTNITVNSVPSADGYVSFIINGIETHVDLVVSTDNTTALVAQKIATKLSETMTEYEVSANASSVTLTRKFGGVAALSSSFSANSTGVSCVITDTTKSELRNLITAIMLNQSNTVYEIRYDFDLNGETIELPEGCTLKFEGGSLMNGSVKGNGTKIKVKSNNAILEKCIICGTFTNNCLYPEWFGSNSDGEVDDSAIMNLYVIESFRNSNIRTIIFCQEYFFKTTVLFKNLKDKIIDFRKSVFKGNKDGGTGIGTIIAISGNNLKICGGIFKTRYYRGSHDSSGVDNGISIASGENIVLDNITVDMSEGGFRGIDVQPGTTGDFIKSLFILNCTTYGGENGIDIITGSNNHVQDVYISNCNIYDSYQGVLINAGYNSLNIENVSLSNINVYNSEFRSIDVRYVENLIIKQCRLLDTKNVGLNVYTSNFDISGLFIKSSTTGEKGIYIYDDSSVSKHELATKWSFVSNIVVEGFKVAFEAKQDFINADSLFLYNYTVYGIANNRKNNHYSNIYYSSDSPVYLESYEKGYGIIIENIYKIKDDGIEKIAIAIPSSLKLNYLGGLLIPNSDGSFYKIATRNDNLTFRNTNGEDILSLQNDKTLTLYGMARIPSGGLYFLNDIPFKIGIHNGNMCIRNVLTNKILAEFDSDGKVTFNDNTLKLSEKAIEAKTGDGFQTILFKSDNNLWIPLPCVCSSDNRPTEVPEGTEVYDSTLKKKILYNGNLWINIDGTNLL